MKKALFVVVGTFIVCLAGIGVWYLTHTSQIAADDDEYKKWAEQRKPVQVEFVVEAPTETPADQPLWISGNASDLGGWDGAGIALAKSNDGKYHGNIAVTSGIEYAFKVTRGSWSTVEKGPSGEEIPNHVLKVDNNAQVPVVVASWVDHGKSVPGLHTMAGTIREHKKFHSNILKNERTIVVYLPPDYDVKKDARYPVLYMHDGQSLFDTATSFNGIEWRADEAAQRLIADGSIEPLIIVGIYNAGEFRTPEFTPPANGSPASEYAKADKYAKFVVEEVKPFIDQTYRTKPDRADTALAGSSMGGLVSLYVAQNYPNVFSKIALLTPHLRLAGDRDFGKEFASGDMAWTKNTKLFISTGDKPGDNYPGKDPVADTQALVKSLENAGLKKDVDFKYIETPGGEHNEPAWQAQFPDVLMYLYGKSAVAQS